MSVLNQTVNCFFQNSPDLEEYDWVVVIRDPGARVHWWKAGEAVKKVASQGWNIEAINIFKASRTQKPGYTPRVRYNLLAVLNVERGNQVWSFYPEMSVTETPWTLVHKIKENTAGLITLNNFTELEELFAHDETLLVNLFAHSL